jgi:hypothetical protein
LWGLFWLLQFSTNSICCGDFDGYYHTKWSRTLWEGMKSRQFPPQFPWLPLTTLNSKEYVDHHLLFHIMQIPFAEFSDPRKGAKVASVVFRQFGIDFVLLVADVFPNSLRARVAGGPDGVFCSVSVSDEHGEGAAAGDRVFGDRDRVVLQKEILAVAYRWR